MFLPTYYVSVLVATLGGSTLFYSYDIVNPEQEVLIAWINASHYRRDGIVLNQSQLNVYWSVAVSSIAIGAIVGSLLTRYLAERLGRRDSLIANSAVTIFGSLLELFSKRMHSPEILIGGRLVMGITMGLASGLVPLYLIEITPIRYRGAAGTMHQVAVAFSDWFSLLLGLPEVFGDKDNWPIAFAFPGAFSLLISIALPFCPESPKFSLLTRGRRDVAIRDLERLVDEEEAKTMLDSLLREAVSSQESKGTYKELFTKRELRFSVLITVWVMVAQQFTGCAAVFAYSTDMFINARISPAVARFSTLALGIAYFVFACASAFLIERVGRRVLSIFQLGFITIALTAIMLFTWLQNFSDAVWISYAVIAALTFYMCVYGVGSPIPWMIAGEIFPTKFRSAAITVSIFVSWLLLFIISLVYLPFKELVGISASFMPFILVTALSTCFVYLLLPETQNKHTDEIADEIHERSKRPTQLREKLRLLSFTSTERRRLYTGSSMSDDSRQSLILDDEQLRYYKYMSLSKLSNGLPPPLTTFYSNGDGFLMNGNANHGYQLRDQKAQELVHAY